MPDLLDGATAVELADDVGRMPLEPGQNLPGEDPGRDEEVGSC